MHWVVTGHFTARLWIDALAGTARMTLKAQQQRFGRWGATVVAVAECKTARKILPIAVDVT